MTKKHLITYTVVALVFGAIGAWLGLRNTAPPAPALAVVEEARSPVGALFAQSMNDASGASHALSRWKGKPLVVNFWAPWCGPCVQEMPELNQLAIDSASANINVIGIGIDSPANIAEFASKLKISYPLYVAGMSGTELARQFGNSAGGLPYTVLIGADGQVIKTYLGKLRFEELKSDLAKLKS
ncbi:MAG: TlpA disulfide reductase family protein [Pseudomonadota bacterium]